MNQINNKIREEWKNEFRKKFTIEETFYELYWKEENPLKIIDFISELLKSQREELVEKIKEYKNKECKESVIDGIKYGLIDGEKICDDIISNLSPNKENKNND